MKSLLSAFVLFFLFTEFCQAESFNDRSKPRIEKLSLGSDFEGGCGCSAYRGDDVFFFSGPEDRAQLIAKIDGRLRKLNFVSSTEDSSPAVGDRFTKIYKDSRYRVSLDHKTTFVCAPSDEGCEVTRYDLKVNVKRGRESSRFSFKGDCGC